MHGITPMVIKRGSSTVSLLDKTPARKKTINSKPIEEVPQQYKLDRIPHYEDLETDLDLKRMVPFLRNYTQQKKADEARAAENHRLEMIHKEKLEKQFKNVKKQNIADMNITFDDKGKILKISRPDPSKFNDIDTLKEII
jgi:hypothetical protein